MRFSRELVLHSESIIPESEHVTQEHKEALAVKFLQLEVILNEADRGLKTDTNEFFKGIVVLKVIEDIFTNLVLVLETITSSVQLTRETFLSYAITSTTETDC